MIKGLGPTRSFGTVASCRLLARGAASIVVAGSALSKLEANPGPGVCPYPLLKPPAAADPRVPNLPGRLSSLVATSHNLGVLAPSTGFLSSSKTQFFFEAVRVMVAVFSPWLTWKPVVI